VAGRNRPRSLKNKGKMKIPFNKPFFAGKELMYITEAVRSGKISGNGVFTNKCHEFFQIKYGFKKVLLTTSCTDALEMAAILINIQPEDEVIAPSYTFVSSVNAFALRGAKIVFCDSHADHPNIDENKIESLITDKTRAIVVVHYAGVACQMSKILKIAKEHNLFVVEDAAQAVDSYYGCAPLGGIGHFGAFSFHETKNIISGEGGMLVINDETFIERAEIIWEKGTNRSQFFRGEVDKYGWVDIGSSFLPSEIIAAFLYAQLEHLEIIQRKRIETWNQYYKELQNLQDENKIRLPVIPPHGVNNGHMFYIICQCLSERSSLIKFLKEKDILSVFHYQSLHRSPFYTSTKKHPPELPRADTFTDRLLRLPLFFELTEAETTYICHQIKEFYK
jgi:dTDP-4-amino-4,6-dideoxygalactose transaminase